ncbi:MAG: alpha-ketoglutarate-dependent dioxygenase AlkB [Actinobacteria bacterium]|nr:MAG: alpha-ketoglutarate-dependent dioxygenase AlkB [Actinomycetota bacterium]
MGTSLAGGVPTVLPTYQRSSAQQGTLALDRCEGERREISPGVVLVSGWLTPNEQAALVDQFREWALPPAGLRHPRVPRGHLMSVQSVCLGWHWQPYAYSRTADDTDGAPVKPLPPAIARLGRRALTDTFGSRAGLEFRPDAVIANLYGPGARLGLHQDAEEPSPAPVVTISIGDTCLFRIAGVDRRTSPFIDLHLHSGDLLVFGGPSRRIYHGVPKVYDNTGPHVPGLPAGRLSLTIRETGLGD